MKPYDWAEEEESNYDRWHRNQVAFWRDVEEQTLENQAAREQPDTFSLVPNRFCICDEDWAPGDHVNCPIHGFHIKQLDIVKWDPRDLIEIAPFECPPIEETVIHAIVHDYVPGSFAAEVEEYYGGTQDDVAVGEVDGTTDTTVVWRGPSADYANNMGAINHEIAQEFARLAREAESRAETAMDDDVE